MNEPQQILCRRRPLSPTLLVKMAVVLGVSAEDLHGEDLLSLTPAGGIDRHQHDQ